MNPVFPSFRELRRAVLSPLKDLRAQPKTRAQNLLTKPWKDSKGSDPLDRALWRIQGLSKGPVNFEQTLKCFRGLRSVRPSPLKHTRVWLRTFTLKRALSGFKEFKSFRSSPLEHFRAWKDIHTAENTSAVTEGFATNFYSWPTPLIRFSFDTLGELENTKKCI